MSIKNYLFGGFCISVKQLPIFFICLLSEIILFRKKHIQTKQMIIYALFISYLSALIDITGLGQMQISLLAMFRGGYVVPNLVPFINISFKQGFLNIMLFIPLGILLPNIFFKEKCSIFTILIISLVLSFTIELLQLGGGRCFDIDDIIMNTLGGILGYIILFFWTSCDNQQNTKNSISTS